MRGTRPIPRLCNLPYYLPSIDVGISRDVIACIFPMWSHSNSLVRVIISADWI
ncbi:hypothetical protein PITC_041820 [Penicillium italicum]|uniref:Uncharacterized protein n=1 Tax=Penicillium italicum TaxID=40296 RepID=A0A0A2KDE4_PENIT|nr:hypothetical protein PITC_041820 [Penicillium italicum]